MKTFKLFLAVAVTAVVVAVAAYVEAVPTAYVGGVPIVVTYNSTAGTPSAVDVTWTTPTGFIPDRVECIDELDGNADRYVWWKGMANESAMQIVAAGTLTYESEAAGATGCGFDVDTAGEIIIDAACLTASESYSCWAVRYQQ